MMTLLRQKTVLVLWFVIFAFIGLIVVEWGADYSGAGPNNAGDAVGVVNGKTITLQEFQDALRRVARQMPQEQRADQAPARAAGVGLLRPRDHCDPRVRALGV